MWLLRRLTPDFKSISDFKRDNKGPINLAFKQFVVLCKSWNLFGKELVAVDGSKFRASNSKKNNFSTKSLNRKIKYLEEKIEEYMIKIEENDIEESIDRQPSKEENVYICPQGEKLYSIRRKPIDEKTKSIIYKNSEACNKCEVRDKCTRDKRGRRISRPIDQDLELRIF